MFHCRVHPCDLHQFPNYFLVLYLHFIVNNPIQVKILTLFGLILSKYTDSMPDMYTVNI